MQQKEEKMERKYLLKAFMFGLIALTSIPTTAIAKEYISELRIVNETKKPLHVEIVPEGSTTEDLNKLKYDFRPHTYQVVNISSNNINKKNYFKIKGDTNWAALGRGSCDNLSIHKNYRITFQERAIGTACYAEEIE